MSDQNRVTILGKKHQVSFSVARLAPLVDVGPAPIDSHASLDTIHHLAASAAMPTALSFSSGKIMPPTVVFGSADLRINKSIDRFIADHGASVFLFQPPSHLSRRPTSSQRCQHRLLKIGSTQQPTSTPMAAFRLLLGIGWLITYLRATVTPKLTRYSRWRAIQSCRDLADCFPGLAFPGNRATLFQRKLSISLSHRNTLYTRCCTWFVNLGYRHQHRYASNGRLVGGRKVCILNFWSGFTHGLGPDSDPGAARGLVQTRSAEGGHLYHRGIRRRRADQQSATPQYGEGWFKLAALARGTDRLSEIVHPGQ